MSFSPCRACRSFLPRSSCPPLFPHPPPFAPVPPPTLSHNPYFSILERTFDADPDSSSSLLVAQVHVRVVGALALVLEALADNLQQRAAAMPGDAQRHLFLLNNTMYILERLNR